MKHLSYPFDQTAKLKITNGSKKILLEAELAASEIEIFQSLNYRQPVEFIQPLVLRFDNPDIQYFSMQSFAFPVVQVCAERKTGLVKRVAPIVAQASIGGNFI